jgi:hypothetical protein
MPCVYLPGPAPAVTVANTHRDRTLDLEYFSQARNLLVFRRMQVPMDRAQKQLYRLSKTVQPSPADEGAVQYNLESMCNSVPCQCTVLRVSCIQIISVDGRKRARPQVSFLIMKFVFYFHNPWTLTHISNFLSHMWIIECQFI